MNTSTSTASKTPISFRWDSHLVDNLREEATRQNTSPSRLAEAIVREALCGQKDEEDEDIPNETTLAAIEEARRHQEMRAKGLPADDRYVDTSSLDAMIASFDK